MDRKPKISAKGTYIFDKDELDQLDELSLTSVIGEVRDSFEQPQKEPEGNSPEESSSASIQEGDPTINELLEDSISSGDPPSDRRGRTLSEDAMDDPEPVEAQDDLTASELLFDRNDDDS